MLVYKEELAKLVLSMPNDLQFHLVERSRVNCGEIQYYIDIMSAYYSEPIDTQEV